MNYRYLWITREQASKTYSKSPKPSKIKNALTKMIMVDKQVWRPIWKSPKPGTKGLNPLWKKPRRTSSLLGTKRNFPESRGENCQDIIYGFLENELKMNVDDIWFHAVHRVGKPQNKGTNPARPPLIIARFPSFKWKYSFEFRV